MVTFLESVTNIHAARLVVGYYVLKSYLSDIKTFLRCKKDDYTFLKPISCKTIIGRQGDFQMSCTSFQEFISDWVEGQCMSTYLTNGEKLKHIIEKDNNWMTPQNCIDICDRKGFSFAGVDGGPKRLKINRLWFTKKWPLI